MTQDEIKRRFWPHELDATQQRHCNALRAQYEAAADLICTLVPASREQSLALTQLEQSAFWAVAAIARH